jgi:hypothetical protein
MPKEKTLKRAAKDRRQGKSASTQAGEFVREEIEEIRAGKHGARSTKQAIAIGLSKARRAGVKLASPKKGSVSEATRHKAAQDAAKGRSTRRKAVSRTRSRAVTKALQREGTSAVSKSALSKQARTAARRRTPAQRSVAARKAGRTRARRRST